MNKNIPQKFLIEKKIKGTNISEKKYFSPEIRRKHNMRKLCYTLLLRNFYVIDILIEVNFFLIFQFLNIWKKNNNGIWCLKDNSSLAKQSISIL